MKITLNNEIVEVSNSISVLELLEYIKQKSKKGIAIAINQQVVPQSIWATTALKDNDQVLIITATQGG